MFQGSLKVWKLPVPEHVEMDPVVGTFLKLPSNEPVNVLVRVYVVKVSELRVKAVTGLSSPPIVITNYIAFFEREINQSTRSKGFKNRAHPQVSVDR